MISLVVTIAIGVPQVFLAWQQLRHSRNQATPQRTGPTENASRHPSLPPATDTGPTPSPGPARPPHETPAEPPPAKALQHREPEPMPEPEPRLAPMPNPRLDPQAGESRPSPPPDVPVEGAAPGLVPALLAYIAPASLWVGGLIVISALGWIFWYDDLVKDYTTPSERVELTVSLWFMTVALLTSSASTGVTAYAWHREKSVTDDNEERFNLYVLMAVVGPPLAVWLVIARRAVMF
ncbi:hypothetical protein JYK22_25575, partial [Nonomuraea sp. RK-328]|nr:hypothetical protein [Nonomuraea sp. RK-328]